MVAFAKRSKRFGDPVGNRTVLNALPDVLTTSTYDAANQKKRDTDLAGAISTFVYDPAGNFSRIVGQPVTFTWDYENRLAPGATGYCQCEAREIFRATVFRFITTMADERSIPASG